MLFLYMMQCTTHLLCLLLGELCGLGNSVFLLYGGVVFVSELLGKTFSLNALSFTLGP